MGIDLNLTPMEFDLLLLLVRKKNVAMSREGLLNEVWGIRYEGGTRTVDVHIAQLRKKTGLPIDFSDERGTTITAHGFLNETNTRGKRRKATVDAVAATIILQDYLDYRRNRKG